MVDADILFLLPLRKYIDIYEMAAIFEFFHNDSFFQISVGWVSTFKTFINVWTFMCGGLSALYPRKCQEKSAKIGSHIYA